jgi:hypothetical protein
MRGVSGAGLVPALPHPGMPHVRLLLMASLLFAAACLNDSPLSPKGEKEIALFVQGVALPGSILEVAVLWTAPPSQLRETVTLTLASARTTVDSSTMRIPLMVDLRPCLENNRAATGAFCDVMIDVKLFESGTLLVSSQEGPVRLVPGSTRALAPVYLAEGNSPPDLVTVETVMRVDPSLLRVNFSALDADGDLIAAMADLRDTGFVSLGSFRGQLAQPYAAYAGAVYVPVPQDLDFTSAKLFAQDTRGNLSTDMLRFLTDFAEAAPAVTDISGQMSSSRVDVSFTVTDPEGDANVVDMVFRNLVDGEIVVADTVYGFCRRPISSGNGRKSISCPRIPGMQKGMAVVVPFDAAGNWGRADRCVLSSSFSCVGR